MLSIDGCKGKGMLAQLTIPARMISDKRLKR
jgi:hypothetical protein